MTPQALVLVAHGSHKNAASGDPARRHADRLRQRGGFAQVVCAFWKEFPSLRDVRYLVDAPEVIIVPLFMAAGYFTGRVLPRELELDGPVTQRDGSIWRYTEPVGTADSMTALIRQRAEAVLADRPTSEVGLVVVGHGTVQNRQSRQAVLDHVERLAASGAFAAVQPAYLEEPPLVTEATAACGTRDVVVVPLFVADGLHTDEDIPAALGLRRSGSGWATPSEVDGRRVWYTSAVGNAPELIEVILERVGEATGGRVPAATTPADTRPAAGGPAAAAWLAWLAAQEQPARFLQLKVRVRTDGRYDLWRTDDTPGAGEPVADWYELARTAADGSYRPLPFAASLRPGWRADGLTAAELLAAVETLYPAAVALWHAAGQGRLEPTPWSQVARRQTGLQGLVKRLSDDAVAAAVALHCDAGGCLRPRLWDDTDPRPPAALAEAGAVPCYEACSLFQNFARDLAYARRGEPLDDTDPRVWQLVTTPETNAPATAGE